MKKIALIFLLFICCHSVSAQQAIPFPNNNPSFVKTWYEEPTLSSGDTITYTLVKHQLMPWDNPAYEYSKITVFDNSNCKVEYWRFCAQYNWTYQSTYLFENANTVKIDFGADKCKNKLKILSLTANQLRVVISEE